jgi:hypothetical protein
MRERDGNLRVIDSATDECGRGESAVAWNEQGPKGDTGTYVIDNDTLNTFPPTKLCDFGESAQQCSHGYDDGAVVTLGAIADNDGKMFDHWEGDCSGTTPTCALTMDQSHSATAVYVPAILVMVQITDPGEKVCTTFIVTVCNMEYGFDGGVEWNGQTCEPRVHTEFIGVNQAPFPSASMCKFKTPTPLPTPQTFTASSNDPNVTFDHWEIDCSGTDPACTLANGITAPVNVLAVFQ